MALYSCHTLSSDNFGPKAFRILDFGTGATILDRAYLGFTQPVASGLWPWASYQNLPKGQTMPNGNPTHTLDEHAKSLLFYLYLGQIADDAHKLANRDFLPLTIVGGAWAPNAMQLRGDVYARRYGVYLDDAEAFELGGTASEVVRMWVRLPVGG